MNGKEITGDFHNDVCLFANERDRERQRERDKEKEKRRKR